MLKAALYYHTLKHLRSAQILGRISFRLTKRVPVIATSPPQSRMTGAWVRPPERPRSLLGPTRVRFLNAERELSLPEDWEASDADRLWLYNLHYFDDLMALGAGDRTAWQQSMMAAWIRDNPAAEGVGWESYPISVRVVNWIKWVHAGDTLDDLALASLAQQLRFLEKRVEWHLLGNHVLANAKALTFGGFFFSGAEADRWREQGVHILIEQLAEQVLDDGGHFERSPMYHAGALEDILDVLNLMRAYPKRKHGRAAELEEILLALLPKMARWLKTMCHPDGGIAFFNDAAFGVAPTLAQLETYADNLGLKMPAGVASASMDLPASGYARLQHGEWCVLFDAAPIGPDYQPGHAHADTLAFEVSVGRERVISNSGTSTYESNAQRAYERSTRAHNTVEIDGHNSSEVWASFRVARRARPIDRTIEPSGDSSRASCAHDGYRRLPAGPTHRRSLEVSPHGVRWADVVEGRGEHNIVGCIPLHPTIRAEVSAAQAMLRAKDGLCLQLTAEGISRLSVSDGTLAPQFGLLQKRQVLMWQARARLPFTARFTLSAK